MSPVHLADSSTIDTTAFSTCAAINSTPMPGKRSPMTVGNIVLIHVLPAILYTAIGHGSMRTVAMSFCKASWAYFALHISIIFSGSCLKPFSANVAATS